MGEAWRNKWENAKANANFPLKCGLDHFCTKVRDYFHPPKGHSPVSKKPPFRI